MTVVASDILSNSKAYQTNPAPSDLLLRFIAQQQELQNYKSVLVAYVTMGQTVVKLTRFSFVGAGSL